MTRQYATKVLMSFFLLSLALMTTPALRAQTRQAQTGSAGGTAPAVASMLEEARRAIDEGNATAMKAWAKGDAAMFVSTFMEDGLEFRPDGSTVKGRQKILELVKASMQRLGPGVELTVKTNKVWLDGETAYEAGKSVYKYKERGQPKTFETLFVSIWKRQQDGTWKLVADMPVPKD
jgi:uncharacterized protein (TIGR02246 family)